MADVTVTDLPDLSAAESDDTDKVEVERPTPLQSYSMAISALRTKILENLAGGDVTLDPSLLSVLMETDSQAAYAAIDNSLLNSSTTGVRLYDGATINAGDNTQLDVGAGSGEILDITDPANPVYTSVAWAATTVQALASPTVSYVRVDSAGNVEVTDTGPTPTTRRLFIWLEIVSRAGGGPISGFSSNYTPIQHTSQQISDFMEAVGRIRNSGLEISASATLESVALSSGVVFGRGVGGTLQDPHNASLAGGDPATFRHATSLGSTGSDRTTMDIGNYEDPLNPGVIIPVPGATTRVTIWTCYMFTNGNFRIFYDRAFYATLDAAQAAISGTRNFAVPDAFEDNALRLGWILTTQDASDMTDTGKVRFIIADRFGRHP